MEIKGHFALRQESEFRVQRALLAARDNLRVKKEMFSASDTAVSREWMTGVFAP